MAPRDIGHNINNPKLKKRGRQGNDYCFCNKRGKKALILQKKDSFEINFEAFCNESGEPILILQKIRIFLQ